jgi:flavodoxin
MKILVVYYSFEGNTRFAAETITRICGADIMELKPVKEISTHGFMKFVWGGRQAVMKKKPPLLPSSITPDNYDLIIIGTPVWAFTVAPPLNSFFEEYPLKDKKIALFCCHEGNFGKTFIRMRSALEGNRIIGQLDIHAPLKKNKEAAVEKIVSWTEDVLAATKRPETLNS